QAIPRGRYASTDTYALFCRAYRDLGDGVRLSRVVLEWRDQSPLDTDMWEKAAEALDGGGDKVALIAFREDCLTLARRFYPPARAEAVEALLGLLRTRG